MADPDIPIRGHEMRLNAKGTVGSFVGRTLIYNKIITRKIWGWGWAPVPLRSASGKVEILYSYDLYYNIRYKCSNYTTGTKS